MICFQGSGALEGWDILRQMGKLPMNIGSQVREKREAILATAAKYGAYNVRIFGSVARGEADSANLKQAIAAILRSL
jgi:hypothetical protein